MGVGLLLAAALSGVTVALLNDQYISDKVERHVSRTVLVLIGLMCLFGLSRRSTLEHFLNRYFPGFPISSRPRMQRALTRLNVLQGWALIGVLVYVDVLGQWAVPLTGTEVNQNPWRLLTVYLPTYVLLLIPAARLSLTVAGFVGGGTE